MPVIDLTRYIVASAGTWIDPTKDTNLFGFTRADTVTPERLLLRWAGDFVALTGPLRVRVTVQSENITVPLALVGSLVPDAAATFTPPAAGGALPPGVGIVSGAALSESVLGRIGTGAGFVPQVGTIYSYTLDIPAGQAWPFSLSDEVNALRVQGRSRTQLDQLGNNLGFRVLIEPAWAVPACPPPAPTGDIPCDFAVADRPNTVGFFPVACEPCHGNVVGLPPSTGVALVAPPAEGGCVRTRFFNGMFITREDLETEQRYHRLKSRLHNRAAGSGVVWGLAVSRQGSRICVLPGYAVDCCGNDLALTTTYQVEIAALLADPAAAPALRLPGPQRLHLLLEYVECPSDPRPVHGDPCAPESTRCEMSRVRESVRLRLVPPRDFKPDHESAPISRFLAEVRALQARFPLGPGPVATGPDRPPFVLRFTATLRDGSARSVAIRPVPNADLTPLRNILVNATGAPNMIVSFRVEVDADPLWAMVDGDLSAVVQDPGGRVVPGLALPAAPVDLSRTGTGLSAPPAGELLPPQPNRERPARFEYRLAGWQAQTAFSAPDSEGYGGALVFVLNFRDFNDAGYFVGEITLASNFARRRLALGRKPCSGEPCAVASRTLEDEPWRAFERDPRTGAPYTQAGAAAGGDPTPVLPWLHEDPQHPGRPADPKVLLLSALGSWLSQMLAREQVGTPSEVTSARREIAQGLYRTAWLMLFGVGPGADPAALGASLQHLFSAWCEALLWKGPQCCGDPHGVVIGCAVVQGGTIAGVDPFGGRRHVVHYPLLAHWGAQFGLAPLDVVASRFFSTLCCVGSLPAVGPDRPEIPANRLELGSGLLLYGDRTRFAERLRAGERLVSERRVGTLEFVAAVVQALTTRAPQTTPAANGTSRDYAAVILGDVVADQTVMLLLPA
jgi:hypothetical protein